MGESHFLIKADRELVGGIGEQGDAHGMVGTGKVDGVFQQSRGDALVPGIPTHDQIFQHERAPAVAEGCRPQQVDHPHDLPRAAHHKEAAASRVFQDEP